MTSSPSETEVLIVGAGPTGLTLACDLARRGVALRIVDAAPRGYSGSRAKGLQPRSLEVLADLGVIDAVLEASKSYPPIRVYDGQNVIHEAVMQEHHEPSPDIPYPNILMLPQWRTDEILRARLAEYGAVVEWATPLTGFTQDDTGVTATLVHEGESESLRVAYLVGTDGGHSTVRRTLGVHFEGTTDETDRLLIGDVHVDGLGRDSMHVWGSEERFVSLCPLPGTDLFQVTASVSAGGPSDPTLATIQSVFAERAGRSDIVLRDASWLSLYRANVRMADRFRIGRVFLAGDAAHVHSPAGGQGMNTGIQDAYNLGWKLGRVLAGANQRLLDTYEEERQPVAAWVLGISSKYHQRASDGTRDVHRGDEARQLDLSYRGQTLSWDWPVAAANPWPDPRAGDRAPDASGLRTSAGAEVRLFDLFRGPHCTLLLFGAQSEARRLAAKYRKGDLRSFIVDMAGDDVDVRDIEGHAHCAYGVPPSQPALIVVRPDGYIGFLAREGSNAAGEVMARYLALLIPQQVAAEASTLG